MSLCSISKRTSTLLRRRCRALSPPATAGAFCAAAAIVLALASPFDAVSMDRDELGKVLKTIPPNGPFWSYGNVVLRGRSRPAGMAAAVFPHWSHRARYTCRVCHQELGFRMRAGDTGITRAQYLSGKYCGACHDGSTAFGVQDGAVPQCDRCHMNDPSQLAKAFATFSESLPMAPFGNGIDWSASLGEGRLSPQNSLKADAELMEFPQKLKKPLKLGTHSPRSDVRFSHEDHCAELDCSSCHPEIFSIKREATENFSMDSNIYGGFCGACHMVVAFPMNDCRRCHKAMSSGVVYGE